MTENWALGGDHVQLWCPSGHDHVMSHEQASRLAGTPCWQCGEPIRDVKTTRTPVREAVQLRQPKNTPPALRKQPGGRPQEGVSVRFNRSYALPALRRQARRAP